MLADHWGRLINDRQNPWCTTVTAPGFIALVQGARWGDVVPKMRVLQCREMRPERLLGSKALGSPD